MESNYERYSNIHAENEILRKTNQELKDTLGRLGEWLDYKQSLLSVISELTILPIKVFSQMDAVEHILNILVQGLDNIQSCSILQYHEDEDRLKLMAAHGRQDFFEIRDIDYNRDLCFKPGEGIAGKVFAESKAYYWDADHSDINMIKVDQTLTTPMSLACLPLTVIGRGIGVINISFIESRPFDSERKRQLQALGSVIANIMQTFHLQEQLKEKIDLHKSAVNALEKTQEHLIHAQKMEAIGTLAGGIAHDFNNLLQAIAGYTQMMLLEKPENDPDYQNVMGIYKAGERAVRLVRQLLLFSRKTGTERKTINLNSAVEHAHGILQHTIPKMVEIEIHLDSRLSAINADPVQIEQILLNLGGNASDAMPHGGKLIIQTENVTLDEEYVQTYPGTKPGRYVLLTVSDNGSGIEKDIMEKIFEPFYTTKEIGKGTGLGLASAFGIVQSHSGYITCSSEVGQGTTFKIYLPAIDQGANEADNGIRIKPPRGGTETILIVDDEKPIRDVASHVLKKFGYNISAVSSGEEALDIYSTKPNKIDMVVLDIGMPGMSGFKCLSEIRRLDPSAKVLIASGYSIDGQVMETLEAGGVGYIGKPFQLTDLLRTVRDLLDRADRAELNISGLDNLV